MLAEKEVEISRLEATLSRGDIRMDKFIYHSWKLGLAQAAKEKARRDAEEAKQAKAAQQ